MIRSQSLKVLRASAFIGAHPSCPKLNQLSAGSRNFSASLRPSLVRVGRYGVSPAVRRANSSFAESQTPAEPKTVQELKTVEESQTPTESNTTEELKIAEEPQTAAEPKTVQELETAEESQTPTESNTTGELETVEEPQQAKQSTPPKPKLVAQMQYKYPVSFAGYSRNMAKVKVSEAVEASLGSFWLRDNCQCSKCIHPDTRQRIVDTFSIPTDVELKDVTYREESIQVEWSDGHLGFYPLNWLKFHLTPKRGKYQQITSRRIRAFTAHKTEKGSYPTVQYEDVMSSDKGVHKWLNNIYIYGFCFVKGVPVDPESTKALLERISFIRHTHYGGFWDFTADLTFKDTAYTTEPLGPHTDNAYFTDPARLQLFHLLSHTDGDGGKSLLVDGFRAARALQKQNPRNYQVLANYPQPYHASGNDDSCIQPAEQVPVFKVHPQYEVMYQIRWNNYDRAAKRDWNQAQQHEWYNAARHFNAIINQEDMQIWTQLEPGTALIFDNWRMLHGRSEFTGKRRMCGGYINNDDFLSRYRLLRFGRKLLLSNLGNSMPMNGNPNVCF